MKEITYFIWNVSCVKIHCVTLSVLEKFNTKFNAIPIYKMNVFYGAEKFENLYNVNLHFQYLCCWFIQNHPTNGI